MRVEIWSDVVCPFCYIGKRHFEQALERFEHRDEVEVIWHSFQLDPNMPHGVAGDLHDYLASRKGGTREDAKAMNDGVAAMAAAAGLTYDLDSAKPANTLDAHRVTHLAAERGLQGPMVERLFAAYFTEGQDLSDDATLARLAAEVGLSADEVHEMLATDRFEDAVGRESIEAHRLGLNGVPAFVIDRRIAVPGAQPADVILGALRQAWEQAPALSS
jgi:predicted DsbA family dithiol-disulfide isomerase